MLTNYRLVVFDFDGTLADSFAAFFWAVERAAVRHGFRNIDRSRLDELRGCSGRQLMKHLGIPLWKVPAIGKDMRRLMHERVRDITLFDGIAELLRDLAGAGVDVAIVTSNSEAVVRAVLTADAAACVKHFECGASIFGKSAKLRRLMRRTGVSARDVLCVGDEMRDYDAAQESGMDFVGVAWGYTTPAALERYSGAPLVTSAAEIVDVACRRPAQRRPGEI